MFSYPQNLLDKFLQTQLNMGIQHIFIEDIELFTKLYTLSTERGGKYRCLSGWIYHRQNMICFFG